MVNRKGFLRDYHLEVATEFHRDGQDAQWASSTGLRFWGDEDECIELEASDAADTRRPSSAMAVSPDGRLLAIAASSIIRILDIRTRKQLSELKGHPNSVSKVVFAPCKSTDGEGSVADHYTLLSISQDDLERKKVIVIWILDNDGRQIVKKPFKPFGTQSLTESAMSAIATDLQKEHRVTTDEFQSIRSALCTAIDAVEKQHRLKALPSAFGGLPHYNSSDLFSSSEGGLKILYLTQNGTTQHGMRPSDELPRIVIAKLQPPDSNVDEEAGTDEQHLQTLQTLQGHSDVIISAAFSPNGKLVASASWDQTFRIWSVETGECLHNIGPTGNQNWTAAFSSSGDHVMLSGGGDRDKQRPLALYNTSTGEEVNRLCHPDLDHWLRHNAIHPDGKSAAVVNNISLLLWDLLPKDSHTAEADTELPNNAIELLKLAMPDDETAKVRPRIMRIFASFVDVAWVDGGKKLLVRANDGTIFAWDRERNVKWRFQRPDGVELLGSGADFAYVDDGGDGTVIALDDDRKVRFWKL